MYIHTAHTQYIYCIPWAKTLGLSNSPTWDAMLQPWWTAWTELFF